MSLCVGSIRRVLARQPAVLGASPRVLGAFSLRGERPGQPEAWRPLHGRTAPFPSGARARAAGRVSGSLQTGPGACLPGGRGWLLWGWVCPFPLPPPPTSSGDRAALLWSFSVPLFCEPPAVCSGRLIFPSLSHSLKKSPSDCSQGLLAGPYPKQCPIPAFILFCFQVSFLPLCKDRWLGISGI